MWGVRGECDPAGMALQAPPESLSRVVLANVPSVPGFWVSVVTPFLYPTFRGFSKENGEIVLEGVIVL